jgi:hypothetical protein
MTDHARRREWYPQSHTAATYGAEAAYEDAAAEEAKQIQTTR